MEDTHVDPGRPLEFHDVMLSRVQDDERSRRAWEESSAADRRRRREEHREAWLGFHEHMRELHAALAAGSTRRRPPPSPLKSSPPPPTEVIGRRKVRAGRGLLPNG